MRELVVLSGKGGTGRASPTASFASLAELAGEVEASPSNGTATGERSPEALGRTVPSR